MILNTHSIADDRCNRARAHTYTPLNQIAGHAAGKMGDQCSGNEAGTAGEPMAWSCVAPTGKGHVHARALGA